MPTINLLELKSKVLTNIYNNEWPGVEKELITCKEKDIKSLNYELGMGFFLAVHQEKSELGDQLYNYSSFLPAQITKVVNLYREMTDDQISQLDEDNPQSLKRGNDDRSVISDLNFRNGKLSTQKLFEFGNSSYVNIKTILKHKAGEYFCKNGCVMCLMNDEQQLASVLLIEYPVQINQDMLDKAVQREMFKLLWYIWLHEKNFTIVNGKEKRYTFNELFQNIQKNCLDKATTRIKEVTDWCFHPEGENMLEALLINNIDSVAGGCASEYQKDANQKLLYKVIENENVVFIKYALQESIFDHNLLVKTEIVNHILNKMENGSNIELGLNILLFSNLSKWKLDLNK